MYPCLSFLHLLPCHSMPSTADSVEKSRPNWRVTYTKVPVRIRRCGVPKGSCCGGLCRRFFLETVFRLLPQGRASEHYPV
ncbi:hypothetical protein FA15DRAFT_177089 [Coprinopsis marcescibilis]|uniref:Secreted protein n=1 Tax=Coprinopsis marcescibilis TaxID=230819 RepID=A0A5C3KGV0_COPMA|nr:hypothetical protein FA15DRAFT_177089 [Coprinopsis marcescibilis]